MTPPSPTTGSRAASPAATGPLAGVRVLDVTSVVMGPYATQLFGDMGADVIAVEPAHGDTNRAMGPGPHRQLSGVALNLLRNKRNVSINFKHPEGRRALLAVAATCDVFVTNLRPSALERAGLTYEDIATVRPDVVYCQAQGYPVGSDRQDEPAYDDVIQAQSGVADAATRVSGQPMLAPTLLADKVCGLTIAYAVSAALFRRSQTGLGEHIEVPMLETVEAFALVEHGAAAVSVPPLGPAGYGRILTPHRRPWPDPRRLDGRPSLQQAALRLLLRRRPEGMTSWATSATPPVGSGSPTRGSCTTRSAGCWRRGRQPNGSSFSGSTTFRPGRSDPSTTWWPVCPKPTTPTPGAIG